jgi:hypothetical protein
MNKDITELFCFIDDFCNAIDKNVADELPSNGEKLTRIPEMKYSETLQ